MSDEYLSHHGIKNQKWGQRRYQNKDGSLTPLGRIRYGKAAKAALDKQQKLQSKRFDKANSTHNPKYYEMSKKEEKLYKKYEDGMTKLEQDKKIQESKQNQNKIETPKPEPTPERQKTVKEMTTEELQAVVNRLKLEQQFAQLQPQQISRGKKIVNTISGKAANVVLERTSKVAGDMFERKLREMVGVPASNQQNQQKQKK